MAQVCFCVALLVHDLIAESEKKLAATDAPPRRDTGDPTFNPFTLFQPRDIFALPGKRRRDEYEAGDAPPLHENEDPTSVGKRTRPGGVPEGVLRPNSPRSPSATSPGSVAKAGVIAPLQPAPVMPAPFTMRPSSPARPAPIDAFAQGSPGKRSRSLRQQGR